ncbi:MAG: hypothetical protein Q8N62_04745 [Candidatus Omnitrophota bacterium]|nr:hypothetical protein [Candidatus Omnitrophota bacterium]
MDLFTQESRISDKNLPLAVRLRPTTLDQLFGQEHILGKNKLLRRASSAPGKKTCGDIREKDKLK